MVIININNYYLLFHKFIKYTKKTNNYYIYILYIIKLKINYISSIFK